MTIIANTVVIIWVLLFVCVIGLVMFLLKKKENMGTKQIREIEKNSSKVQDKEIRQATEEDKQKWKTCYLEAERLADEMILLIGGKTGMVMQRHFYLHSDKAVTMEECRDNFLKKQKRLKEAYKQYYVLKKEIENLPEDAGKRLEILEQDDLYQELMNETFE